MQLIMPNAWSSFHECIPRQRRNQGNWVLRIWFPTLIQQLELQKCRPWNPTKQMCSPFSFSPPCQTVIFLILLRSTHTHNSSCIAYAILDQHCGHRLTLIKQCRKWCRQVVAFTEKKLPEWLQFKRALSPHTTKSIKSRETPSWKHKSHNLTSDIKWACQYYQIAEMTSALTIIKASPGQECLKSTKMSRRWKIYIWDLFETCWFWNPMVMNPMVIEITGLPVYYLTSYICI